MAPEHLRRQYARSPGVIGKHAEPKRRGDGLWRCDELLPGERRGDGLDLELTVFTLHYTDRIVSALTGAVTPTGRDVVQSQNVASADIYGIETAVHYEISMALSADIIVNVQRGEQDDPGGLAVPADRMPPLNGRLGFVYQASNRLTIEPYFVLAASQDRLSPRDVRDVRINPAGTPGWATANIAANWAATDNWHFRMSLRNLADKRYRAHGSGIDSVGRNFVLSADMRW